MNIKNVAIATASLVFVAIICVLISNYTFERNLHSINLPAASYEKERVQQPTKASESIADKPVSKVEEKIEVGSYEELMPDMLYDDALTSIEPEDEDVALEDKETGEIMEEGPPSHKIARPLPIFEPTISDMGPMPKDSDIPYSKLPETTEQYDYGDASASADIESKPLPSFTPVTNKTGPIAADKNRY